MGETLCPINPKDERVGGVWARLGRRDKAIAETKNRTDDIAVR